MEELRLRGGVPPLCRPGGGGVDPPRCMEPPPHRGGPPPGGGDGGAGLGTHHFRPTARGLCHPPRRGTPGDLREGAVRDGTLLSFRRITSLALRVPPHHGGDCLPPLLPRLNQGGRCPAPSFSPPPGLGKTTLLRDLIRCLSLGGGTAPRRGGVADERGGAGGQGALRYALGPRADVLENCPKAQALMMLLRGMSPRCWPPTRSPTRQTCGPWRPPPAAGSPCWPPPTGGSWGGTLPPAPLPGTAGGGDLSKVCLHLPWRQGRRVYTVQDGGGPP